jgi:hypothetical protein
VNKSANEMQEGEAFEGLTFTVSPEFNEQYLFAQADYPEQYRSSREKPAKVYPALLMQMLAQTRSPGYWIPSGLGAVVGSTTTKFFRPAWVGETYKVTWTVTKLYEKRGKRYHEVEATLFDDDGNVIMERLLQLTYVSG